MGDSNVKELSFIKVGAKTSLGVFEDIISERWEPHLFDLLVFIFIFRKDALWSSSARGRLLKDVGRGLKFNCSWGFLNEAWDTIEVEKSIYINKGK